MAEVLDLRKKWYTAQQISGATSEIEQWVAIACSISPFDDYSISLRAQRLPCATTLKLDEASCAPSDSCPSLTSKYLMALLTSDKGARSMGSDYDGSPATLMNSLERSEASTMIALFLVAFAYTERC